MIYWITTLLFRLVSARPRKLQRRIFTGITLGVFSLAFFLVLSIGQHDTDTSPSLVQHTQEKHNPVSVNKPASLVTETGDLNEIKQRGRLRILLQKQKSTASKLVATEKKLIMQYALEQDLDAEWLEIDQAQHLFASLQSGEGDIVLSASAVFSLQDERDQMQLTLPWGVSQQQVISRSDTGRIRNIDDLTTRQIAVKRSSPIWEELQALVQASPSMDLIVIPEAASIESILQRVASAQYDVSVLDNLAMETYLPKFLSLEVAFNVTEAQTISWGVRSSAKELQASLNRFLKKQYLESDIARSYQEDLPALQSKKVLRLITYQSPINYYLHQGKLKGFEHDLVKRFAQSHQMRLDVVIADSHAEMQGLLLAGKGDVLAASLPRRSFNQQEQLAFTQPYNHAAPVLVGRTKDTLIMDVRGLTGRRVVLPAASPYERILQGIRAQGIDFDIVIADANESAEAILFRVSSGIYDLTVIGGQELKAQFVRQINLRAHFALTEPLPHVWVVREADTQLMTALNDFIGREFRKGLYNQLYAKYIDNPRTKKGDTQLLARVEKLSPYDEIVHKYAEHYDFDWRLIVAQMYQESQFDPYAVSYAGAEGLMQLIPETAELLGVADVSDPDTSIQAGVRYMDYLRGKFDDELLLEDRLWFSLAAYNAGYNRVRRARLLAERMDLDKNKWFDNVEKAMLALARPYWKDGETKRNCRCGQTVVYVRDIKTLYNNYVRLTRPVKTAAKLSELSQDI
jgi:peptidoglycan lytic transglycosylase F